MKSADLLCKYAVQCSAPYLKRRCAAVAAIGGGRCSWHHFFLTIKIINYDNNKKHDTPQQHEEGNYT